MFPSHSFVIMNVKITEKANAFVNLFNSFATKSCSLVDKILCVFIKDSDKTRKSFKLQPSLK